MERLRADRPAVVVLDLIMPRLDGYGFPAEQLRDETVRSIPVICASAHETERGRRTILTRTETIASGPGRLRVRVRDWSAG
jgi:CheY-like chemotaxis protein